MTVTVVLKGHISQRQYVPYKSREVCMCPLTTMSLFPLSWSLERSEPFPWRNEWNGSRPKFARGKDDEQVSLSEDKECLWTCHRGWWKSHKRLAGGERMGLTQLVCCHKIQFFNRFLKNLYFYLSGIEENDENLLRAQVPKKCKYSIFTTDISKDFSPTSRDSHYLLGFLSARLIKADKQGSWGCGGEHKREM